MALLGGLELRPLLAAGGCQQAGPHHAAGATYTHPTRPCCCHCCAEVFSAMTVAKEHMTVLDWGIANATLEEVSGSRGGQGKQTAPPPASMG